MGKVYWISLMGFLTIEAAAVGWFLERILAAVHP